jgi:glycosyltransferase A (GT-A) superfamily protein (DUF2064 family)
LYQNTAILIFSRSAKAEVIHKSFTGCRNKRLKNKLASGLIKNTVDAAISSNIPYYIIDEQKQRGVSFGEKIANAVEEVFSNGYENLIVVGNDCAQLSATVIQNASEELKCNDVVVGPDNRGGVYLIGINKRFFNKATFQTLSWQTKGLSAQLLEVYASANTLTLPLLNDINNIQDLVSVNKLLSCWHKLKVVITSVLASTAKKTFEGLDHYYSYRFSLLPLRAPPTV